MVPGQPVWAQGAPEESGWPFTELSLVGATLRVALIRAAGRMAPGWAGFLDVAGWRFPGLGSLGSSRLRGPFLVLGFRLVIVPPVWSPDVCHGVWSSLMSGQWP
jgi:hypothetical protein